MNFIISILRLFDSAEKKKKAIDRQSTKIARELSRGNHCHQKKLKRYEDKETPHDQAL